MSIICLQMDGMSTAERVSEAPACECGVCERARVCCYVLCVRTPSPALEREHRDPHRSNDDKSCVIMYQMNLYAAAGWCAAAAAMFSSGA